MSWFSKISVNISGPIQLPPLTKDQFLDTYNEILHYGPSSNVYKPNDIFECVFLGGADDIQRASEISGGFAPENIIDVRSLPELPTWNSEDFVNIGPSFQSFADIVLNKLTSGECPIYVHCAVGANRSASVLAAVLSRITSRPLLDVISEMKEQRSDVAPDTAYYLLAYMYSKGINLNSPDNINYAMNFDPKISNIVKKLEQASFKMGNPN